MSRCAFCGKSSDFHCFRCKITNYCSEECQKKDFQKHKEICVIDAHSGTVKYQTGTAITLLQLVVSSLSSSLSSSSSSLLLDNNNLNLNNLSHESHGVKIVKWEECRATHLGHVSLELDNGKRIDGLNTIASFLAMRGNVSLLGGEIDAAGHTEVNSWIEFCNSHLSVHAKKETIPALFALLDSHLASRVYLVNNHVTLADFTLLHTLMNVYENFKCLNGLKHQKKESVANISRWFDNMVKLPFVDQVVNKKKSDREQSEKVKKDQMGESSVSGDTGGSYANFHLPNAETGKVVTRFPPEPSGYLHIGHAKAAILNSYFAKRYDGKLIIRFDDTNPAKEKQEYVDNILKDLATMRIVPDRITRSSDYFEQILVVAEKLIRDGKAYVDDTPVETMREWRTAMIDSPARSHSVEKNLEWWKEMIAGSAKGQECTLRAKIDMKSKNGTMRDPVLYRVILEHPHHVTGKKYKVYPTYDLAMPIIDSWEGVTHALRSNEYHERNEQYYWIAEAAGVRAAAVEDFGRVNFVYTLMSKRKLTTLVDSGAADGWDDPRFPTIQGLLRRGMTMDAIWEFIIIQGPSKNIITMEWEKLWVINRRMIDSTTARYSGIPNDSKSLLTIVDGPTQPEGRSVFKNKKNEELGKKITIFSNSIWLDLADAKEIAENEEVTLMDWGNVIITKKSGDSLQLTGKLNLAGDFKKTEKKLHWVANTPEAVLTKVVHFDYLINKKKLEDDDNVDDFMTEKTWFETTYICDANIRSLQRDEKIQLERVGYFRVDHPFISAIKPAVLFNFPDGKKIPDPPAPKAKPASAATTPAAAAAAAAPASKTSNAKSAAAPPPATTATVTTATTLTAEERSKLEAEITAQGEVVRKLKADKAEKAKVDAAVEALKLLKAKLPATATAPATPAPTTTTTTTTTTATTNAPATVVDAALEAEIAAQGEKVRKLKADKADKATIDAEVEKLKTLKAKLPATATATATASNGESSKKKK